jgi:hypothetical protein
MLTEVEKYNHILIQVISTKFHDPFSIPRVFISDLVEKEDAKEINAFLGQSFNHHAVTRLFIHKVLHHYAQWVKIRIA